MTLLPAEENSISARMSKLKLKAALRYNISPQKAHIGHVILEAMLSKPQDIHQIDGATDTCENNISVATRTMRLASAIQHYGLLPGDTVVIMGPNHLDLAVAYYACHFNGHAMCCVDPINSETDVRLIFQSINPKMVLCQKSCLEKVNASLAANNQDAVVITFDDNDNNMETFIKKYGGSEVGYRPSEFDMTKTNAWLMMTSGTTGTPKATVYTFDKIYNCVIMWWDQVPDKISFTMTMTNTQWVSGLLFFLSTPLKPFTRVQSSLPLTPQLMAMMIMKYKPDATGWTPYLLSQFVAAGKGVDLSSLKHILIAGAPMDKANLEKFKTQSKANLYLVYGMTEILVPAFKFSNDMPFGASGKPVPRYKYKLIDDDGNEINEPHKSGELYIKGEDFFKEYMNSPEETKTMYTEDGWLKTGDLFFRDEEHYYYFVERRRLLVRYLTHFLSPLQMENIIKQHPGVAEAVVVAIPNAQTMELPVAAIKVRNGATVTPDEIFGLLKSALPELKQLHGGLFFVDTLPITVSGKINRSKIAEIARTVNRIMPK